MVKAISNRDMRQGSEKWKDLRSCLITGSQYVPWTRPSNLKKHKDAVKEKADHWTGASKPIPRALQRMFDWGHFHEGIARSIYTTQMVLKHAPNNVSVKDHISMLIDDEGMIAASPDGVVTITNIGRGVIEIKCPVGQYFFRKKDVSNGENFATMTPDELTVLYDDMEAHSEVGDKYYDMDNQLRIGGKLEDHYLQCLGNLHLSGADWIDYIVYVPFKKWVRESDGTLSNMRVKRLTKDDTLSDWDTTRVALESAYSENEGVFTKNIEEFLAKYRTTDLTRD